MGQWMMPGCAVFLPVLLSACAAAPGGLPRDDVPSLTGVVTAVTPGPEGMRVTIEGSPDPARSSPDSTSVALVGPDTEIRLVRADGSVRGGLTDVAVGARVRVEHSGTQLRSLPPQYVALRVWVLPGADRP